MDTNILLNNAQDMLVEDTLVILCETVLSETDKHKGGFEEINFQARAAARILESAEIVVTRHPKYGTITELLVQSKYMLGIVALNSYEADAADYGGNDRRIIEVAQKLGCPLMTNDLHMKFQAIAKGVEVTSLKAVEDVPIEFVKELAVEDDEQFRTLHNSDVLGIDPDYQIGNYSYKFTNPNTNQMKLATVTNGFVSVLGDTTEKDLRKQRCGPINSEQLLASKAIQDPTMDLVLIEGLAGSGKNVVALSNAIRLVETNRDKYSSIVYIRSPINDEESGEDIGYLAGNDEKMSVYLGPMEDTLDFIVRSEINPKGKKKIEIDQMVEEKRDKLVADCGMESMISTGLRGRTFHDTVFIIDEAQNGNTATTQKILTRVGKNCKVIVIGSQRQIDNKYVNKYNNGLAVLMDEANRRMVDTDINMFAITLHKVVRSDMALFAEGLFSK